MQSVVNGNAELIDLFIAIILFPFRGSLCLRSAIERSKSLILVNLQALPVLNSYVLTLIRSPYSEKYPSLRQDSTYF